MKETLNIDKQPLEKQLQYWKKEFLELSKENEQLKQIIYTEYIGDPLTEEQDKIIKKILNEFGKV